MAANSALMIQGAYENVALQQEYASKNRSRMTNDKGTRIEESLTTVPYTHEAPYILRHEDGRLWQHTMKGLRNVIPICLDPPKEKYVERTDPTTLPEFGQAKKKRRDTAIRDSLAEDLNFKTVNTDDAWASMEDDFLTGTTVVFPKCVHKKRIQFCCMCQMGRKYHEPCPLQPDIGPPGRDNDDDIWMLPGTDCPPYLEPM